MNLYFNIIKVTCWLILTSNWLLHTATYCKKGSLQMWNLHLNMWITCIPAYHMNYSFQMLEQIIIIYELLLINYSFMRQCTALHQTISHKLFWIMSKEDTSDPPGLHPCYAKQNKTFGAFRIREELEIYIKLKYKLKIYSVWFHVVS